MITSHWFLSFKFIWVTFQYHQFSCVQCIKGPKIFDAKTKYLADAIWNALTFYWWWLKLYFYNYTLNNLILERSIYLYLKLKYYVVDITVSLTIFMSQTILKQISKSIRLRLFSFLVLRLFSMNCTTYS